MILVEIKRPSGEIETVDMTGKVGFSDFYLQGSYKATLAAGRGEVLRFIKRETKSNLNALIKAYNDGMNEGGEGYVPDNAFFKAKKEYKEWTEELILERK